MTKSANTTHSPRKQLKFVIAEFDLTNKETQQSSYPHLLSNFAFHIHPPSYGDGK